MIAASTRLGPYEVVAPLGAGGMGEIYRARDTRLDRAVAVKVLPPQFAQDPARLARFEREAKAVAALSHPNILAIHDVGAEQGVTFLVTELLEGESLRQRLAESALPWRKAVEIGIGIADGLAAAHAKAVIHRDIKPDNVFLTTDERVKILDFGLARIETGPLNQVIETQAYTPEPTRPGAVMGTPPYMSPEQLRGQPVDARSDIFSLGCVLYEMAAGRRAFAGNTDAELSAAILHHDPPDLAASAKTVPPEFERLIRHCLEKKPEARFHSAHDVAFALRAVLSDSGLPKPPLATIRSRRFVWIAAGALATLLGIGLYLHFKDGKDHEPSPPAALSKAIDSVAILPLVNVGELEGDLLCESIAEHVTNSLVQVRDRQLKVRPFTSTSHYKGQKADPQTAGRELDVRAVVIGRLRQQGNELTVNLELVDVRDQNVVWSKPYQGKRTEILLLQDEIARDIAANLGLRLTAEQEKTLTRRYTNDNDAWLLFLEGRRQWDLWTEEGLESSIKHFQKAIDRDPKFALAFAWQAHAYNVMGHQFRSAKEYVPKAKHLAAEALKIDPKLAEAYSLLGNSLLFYDRDLPAAEKALQQALEYDPKSSTARLLKYLVGAARGRVKEALAEAEQLVRDDPLWTRAQGNMARMYIRAGRHDEAVRHARKAIDLKSAPDYATLGEALSHKKEYQAAIDAFEQALDILKDNPNALGGLGYTYAKAGKPAEANGILKQLLTLPSDRPNRALGLAAVYTGLGDKDQAIKWLRHSAEQRDAYLIFIKVDLYWESLRGDLRFTDLLKDMGLPP